MGVGSVDRDVIERFHRIVGVGAIHGRHSTSSGKRFWYWKCSRADDILELVGKMYNHLGDRRRAKADEVIAICEAVQARRIGPFVCDICSFEARSFPGLRNHLSRTHNHKEQQAGTPS